MENNGPWGGPLEEVANLYYNQLRNNRGVDERFFSYNPNNEREVYIKGMEGLFTLLKFDDLTIKEKAKGMRKIDFTFESDNLKKLFGLFEALAKPYNRKDKLVVEFYGDYNMAKLDCDLFKSGCEGLELYEEIDTKLIGATKSVKGAVLHNPDTTDSIQYRIYVYGTSAGRSPPQFHSENNNRKVIIARTLKSVDKAIEFAGEMDAKLLEFYQTLKR